MDYSKVSLGILLSSPNKKIKSNAVSILKTLKRCTHSGASGISTSHNLSAPKISYLWICTKCGLSWKTK